VTLPRRRADERECQKNVSESDTFFCGENFTAAPMRERVKINRHITPHF
jgi:hypothetical protein